MATTMYDEQQKTSQLDQKSTALFGQFYRNKKILIHIWHFNEVRGRIMNLTWIPRAILIHHLSFRFLYVVAEFEIAIHFYVCVTMFCRMFWFTPIRRLYKIADICYGPLQQRDCNWFRVNKNMCKSKNFSLKNYIMSNEEFWLNMILLLLIFFLIFYSNHHHFEHLSFVHRKFVRHFLWGPIAFL